MVRRKKRILAVCGTGGVTSSVIASKVREISREHGIDIEIHNCKAFEVKSKVATSKYDLIISTTRVGNVGVPVVKGFAFLSGIGEEEVKKQIIEALQE
jgi:PTS system galactitol-specific IIB component